MTFKMTGPTGKGLSISSSGLHIAFCAGTGALVFLDLVAALLLRNRAKGTGVKVPEDLDESQLSDDFNFHLFVSFQDLNNTVGLDLCTKLRKMNMKFGIDNFKLTVRLSSGEKLNGDEENEETNVTDPGFICSTGRWDKSFIDEKVSDYAGKIKRIWVFGPPMMNETFDRAFENIIKDKGEQIGLDQGMVEIL